MIANKPRSLTQRDKILSHLQNNASIDALYALNHFGCFRLAARILELKHEGFDITSEPFKTTGGATISEYSLISKTVEN